MTTLAGVSVVLLVTAALSYAFWRLVPSPTRPSAPLVTDSGALAEQVRLEVSSATSAADHVVVGLVADISALRAEIASQGSLIVSQGSLIEAQRAINLRLRLDAADERRASASREAEVRSELFELKDRVSKATARADETKTDVERLQAREARARLQSVLSV